tara:strand:+ start:369 stop:1058 length:690 start_codon:yes stop_codon:yes gene_type:complete
MKIAIMQPYLLPYIGYWQLINTVDRFIIFDDVNYINKGYINRNKILVEGKPYQFTLELVGASQNKLINEIQIGKNSNKILKTIELNYKKSLYFKNVFPLIEDIFNQEDNNLAKFIGYSLKKITDYLEIDVSFAYSSEIVKNNDLKNQDKIINICEKLNAKEYINLMGGLDLYDKEIFRSKNIRLSFIETKKIKYKQFNNKFVPFLSIIDIMMHNNKNLIAHMLKNFKLI